MKPIPSWMNRTELLLGSEKLEKLARSNVLVAGLGGVGAYAAEQIVRAGIGKMTIVDCDIIDESNKNRQLLALNSTLGKLKTEIMAGRLLDINPELKLTTINSFLKNEKIATTLSQSFDYVVDAIDTLSPKLFFILQCLQNKLPLVSSMGSGGKTDPMQVNIADISESYGCRLALFIRKRLHKRGIYSGFPVVFSPESTDRKRVILNASTENKKSSIGTISYMPAIFGCFCASVVIRNLTETE
ncbi:MAG TPA: tRNA threonylcarbamoyladenosine dehydratase [Bacteroidales bacterium]|nr:tRNA threonylcarbamoyladenosine dehydratase [Bacteroidales bacterium]HPR57836.1 tRNA threonylcarbamoyladenosine dehydratase [Bacteroidales bacterium]